MLAVASVFLRYRARIVGAAVGSAAAALAFAVARPTTFVSTVSFVPQTTAQQQLAPIAALSGAFGINLGSSALSDSPDFYVELMRSRPILERLAVDTFHLTTQQPAFTGTIADYLGLPADSPDRRAARAVRWLRDRAVRTGVRRGVVEIRVATGSPELSQQIAQRALAYLGEFNVDTRQARAAAERRFLEDRVAVARAEVQSAELNLQRFLQTNRQYENSPGLRLQYESAQRDIEMRQRVLTSLLQQYEQARIDEVRNIPVVSVIDQPSLPPLPEPRRLPFALVAGLLAGGAIATLAAFIADQRRQRAPLTTVPAHTAGADVESRVVPLLPPSSITRRP